MRKSSALFLAALLATCGFASEIRAGVFLSELCDPQSNYQTDRFIEIYNSGPSPVDLTNWSVTAIANGADVCTWNLSGALAVGEAKVCGHTSTVSGFTVHFQNSLWGTSAYFNWNGKVGDGAKLKNLSTLIESVIASGDLFNDKDMVRNANISEPNTTYTPSEWTITPVTLATSASPGTHNGSLPPPSGPVIANISTFPASPTANVAVYVSATVVDSAGPISSVAVNWGLSSGSLPNAINMSLVSDSTYTADSGIPGQTAGVSIYYRISATGFAQTGQSNVRSYTIPGTSGAPTILAVGEMSDSTLLVTFSEPVQEASAEVVSNYSVGALVPVNAVWDPARTSEVTITVRNLTAGAKTLTVTGVQDLDNNPTSGATKGFTYIDVTIPAGYYASTAGLVGSPLRVALHNLMKNHTVTSYSFALTAFATTDIKPNGKIWDMYSDIPGGTPPYEYNYGDQGQGATEGLGYNREHTWPQSWFSSASPMVSDLWNLFPSDAKVNGYRANYPFGDVGTATITSLNGSKVGPNISPGYSGTVFEPIDPYKGDLARFHFYMSTRYFGQDASWPGSPSTDGAEFLPWALTLYRQWHANDPVAWKERMRNSAIYGYQNNRNPFVDHPEYLEMIWDSTAVTAVGQTLVHHLQLRQNTPNPFSARTTIGFDLARSERVTLSIFDLSGRRVRTFTHGSLLEPGRHSYEWNGRGDDGALLEAGLYFCRLHAGATRETKRMVFAR
ncbi:MAG: endonuclease [Candidatus Eisenbacteria bacterium]